MKRKEKKSLKIFDPSPHQKKEKKRLRVGSTYCHEHRTLSSFLFFSLDSFEAISVVTLTRGFRHRLTKKKMLEMNARRSPRKRYHRRAERERESTT